MIRSHDAVDESIGSLVGRVLEDGRDYVRAEVDVVRETARVRVAAAKIAIIVGVAAIFVVQAGLTILFIGIGTLLARFVGAAGGQLLSAVLAFVTAGLMVKYAVAHFSPATKVDDRGRPSV